MIELMPKMMRCKALLLSLLHLLYRALCSRFNMSYVSFAPYFYGDHKLIIRFDTGSESRTTAQSYVPQYTGIISIHDTGNHRF